MYTCTCDNKCTKFVLYTQSLTLYQKVIDMLMPPLGRPSIQCHLRIYRHVTVHVTVKSSKRNNYGKIITIIISSPVHRNIEDFSRFQYTFIARHMAKVRKLLEIRIIKINLRWKIISCNKCCNLIGYSLGCIPHRKPCTFIQSRGGLNRQHKKERFILFFKCLRWVLRRS